MLRRPGGILIFLACLLGGFVCEWAQAAAPKPFMRMGKIGSIAADAVLIGDTRYALANNVRVYTYDPAAKDIKSMRDNARMQSRSALGEGMEVGYTVEGEGGGKRVMITEIWLLPAGSMRTLQSQD
jgi:hypothetical protein